VLRGKTYRFQGSKQRTVIKILYEALLAGSPVRHKQEVFEEAECGRTVNTFGKLFSGRDDWRDLLEEDAGQCWMIDPCASAGASE
jgi:hypothetical protein